jgi:transcriptional regulator with XRE-family HTH domain
MQVPPRELTQQFPGLRLTLARQMADYRERMATRIAEEREAQSLSREALAHRSGVSYKTIKRIEERKSGRPRAITVRRLAEGLGIDPTELKPPVEAEEDQLDRIEAKLNRLLEAAGLPVDLEDEGEGLERALDEAVRQGGSSGQSSAAPKHASRKK